ncbi:hypothetical protein QMK17_13355 [Rhodococcus sp. G-MC3]|uniref:hypothetical protein n=1 Tax=Rhodococcus sp. G-MC3 TaxID=3046209 RepID=UPI0024BA7709|nr:hypothetical protein [Rhodococcus sp. G-MC3]MDJ0394314.1 hypothetical protein [Rhodococcus sp. G-MC3]
MTKRKWYDNPTVDRWGTLYLLVVSTVLVGPRVVGNVMDDPSPWNITFAALCLLAFVVIATSFVRHWRNRNRASPPKVARVDPNSVPTREVWSARSSSSSRISAIKKLRESYPGLGLRDAADLVDDTTEPPNP